MKNIFLFTLIFLSLIKTNAQNFPVAKSLDDFFAGIPLQQGFTKWIEYMAADSTLAIDSSSQWGFYSSYKKNRDHFPFPNHIPVKILLFEDLRRFTDSGAISYHKSTINIEGIFPPTEEGRKTSKQFFRQLKEEFKTYYSKHPNSEEVIDFTKSGNENFPGFTLYWGRPGHGYNFYYVTLQYVYIAKL